MWNLNDTLKIATVFSGIGAPEFALKRAGIKHKLIFACDNGELDCIESDESILKGIKDLSYNERLTYINARLPKKVNQVKKSFLANHSIALNDFHHNVKFVDGNHYRDQVDIFIGGSPCQSFTLLGYQKGLEEARGTLFYDFARLIKEIQPKAFIYENVQGLIKHDKGRTWEVVKRVFDTLEYNIFYNVLDAVDYGIPQKRRRVFVVGFKTGGENFVFPPKIDLPFTLQDFLLDNTPIGNFTNVNGKIQIIHSKGDIPSKYFLSDRILPGIMSEGTGGFSMKPEIDLKIARPLMRTMHKMHRAGEDNYVTTNGRIRRLTPRECLRLMGFTDDFVQVVSDTQMYQQAGNSMVVDVMKALILEILKAI
ncbi:MAG: DNA (cytosine-5-)-methyltransferase [Bacteroidales bacterium]|nr:DNA (cytosine-5-)-methyltransferase [Bacteroidales bacterium]